MEHLLLLMPWRTSPPWRLLEHRRHRPLRIRHHRHPAHAFDTHRLNVESSADLFGLRSGGIHIGDREIDQPVGSSFRIAMLLRRDTADELLAMLDVQITRRVLFTCLQLPAEKSGVKLLGAFGIRSTQVGPAECSWFAGDTNPRILLSLPNGEHRARWVFNDGHSANIADIE